MWHSLSISFKSGCRNLLAITFWALISFASFSAIAAKPNAPTGTAPGSLSNPGPTLSSSAVTLTWHAAPGATFYGVGVRDLVTNSLVVSSDVTTNRLSASLTPGRSYRWNLAACNASGCSAYTSPMYFLTPAPVKYTLSVNKTGTGAGAVTGGGVDCGSTCSISLNMGLTVGLTASAMPGSTFAGWSGACTGAGACTVNMSAAKLVGAEFRRVLVTPPPPPPPPPPPVSTPSVSFPSNVTQYVPFTVAVTWSITPAPSTAVMDVNDSDLVTTTRSGSTVRFTFLPQLAGSKNWQVKAAPGSASAVLARGATTVNRAPDFAYTVPARNLHFGSDPGGWYCFPQCVNFVRENLGLPGGRAVAADFWSNPHTGYSNYAQGSRRPPRPGDILVWKKSLNPTCAGTGCGHVAIVISVDLASETLVMADANWSGNWRTDCTVRVAQLTVRRDPGSGGYTIGGDGRAVAHLHGWQSRN